MAISLSLFALAFFLLWIGSGLAVNSITKISHSLKFSSFFVSFFVLGLFTSITEITIGINALLENTPEIYVGNLIGSSVVVFLLVVPILAVVGKGVHLNHSFLFKDLVSAILVVGLPAFLTLDNRFGIIDSVLCIIIYGYFLFMLEKESGVVNKILHVDMTQKTLVSSFFKIVAAILLVFAASKIMVDQTPIIGEFLGISPFIISILLISIGTNIPELSVAIRSILAKKKDIAFGNYVGSASLNTLEMGVLSLLGKSPVPANGSNYSVIAFLIGLVAFVFFVKSKKEISKEEGLILFGCYLVFVFFELFTGPGWSLIING